MAIYYHIDDKDELIRLVVEESGIQDPRSSRRRRLGSVSAPVSDSSWESLARYPGLGAHMIELPTLGVTPERARDGIHFFEESGFSPANAPLAWSFALTYIHGRISVDARLARQPEAPRLNGLHAPDYVEFGVEAVIRGLRPLRQADVGEVDPGSEAAVTTGS